MSLAAAHNLPPQPTALLGREDVLREVSSLLWGPTRLLTLLGPGGVGKTRLAVELATTVRPDFAGGAWFIDLSGGLPPAALPAHLARVLGLTLDGADPLDSLVGQLPDQPLLVLLDNFESVPDAAPLLGQLLGACPALRVIVTSRVALNLRWERRLEVPPLALPEPGSPSPADASPAVQLYLERARAAGGPEVTDLGAAARLCARLDGLPLAIELAAARAAQFGPAALLARLERHLALPSTPAPDRPARHHSLNAVIGASYDMLSAAQQATLRRLAVAAGGVGENAARVMAETDALGIDALDVLLALTDVNLLSARPGHDGQPRFWMLETVRDYAGAQADPAEFQLARQRHAQWCLELAERLTPEWRSEAQAQVLAQLNEEHPNVRAALAWTLRAQANLADRQVGVQLAEALWPYWLAHGHLGEGRAWLEAALSGAGEAGLPGLYRGAGVLARQQGDLAGAVQWAERATLAAQLAADTWQEAAATGDLGVALALQGDLGRASAALDRQLSLQITLGDQHSADALNNRGAVALRAGDFERATDLLGRVLTMCLASGDARGEADVRSNLGVLACQAADWPLASAHLSRALELRRQLCDRHGEAETLGNLGTALRLAGDAAAAAALHEQALTLRQQGTQPQAIAPAQLNLGLTFLALGRLDEATPLLLAAADSGGGSVGVSSIHRAGVLQALATLAARREQWPWVARLLGASRLFLDGGSPLWPGQQAERATVEAQGRQALGGQSMQAELALGERTPWDTLIAGAADMFRSVPTSTASALIPTHRDDLSEREREVLALLVRGWPNKKIASAMKLADNTVKNHLASVYSKLGVRGRAEAVARALQERLLE
ncbi:tetratricopeptide repeat protein [Deinococcus koreensis]|uniref:HTH luxR-type domain-containing protein n=1 Tax=Deinococcus koreensis TaxID=2054903 RepID=A0A2K3UT06_9DEIO|nr:tetratricopeptide repeat protein [Deinococcus koreensis]PNY79673.1 hypothetical protein CVO96_17055 [Deinococcus koreensis]